MNETWNQILTAVIVPIIVALVPFLINYLNRLSEEVKGRMKDKTLEKYIDIATDAIETSVLSVMQTFVDPIKGTDKWTKEVQKEAFDKAKIQALNIMGTAVRTALREVYGDLDGWINSKIEECVKYHKATIPGVTSFTNNRY